MAMLNNQMVTNSLVETTWIRTDSPNEDSTLNVFCRVTNLMMVVQPEGNHDMSNFGHASLEEKMRKRVVFVGYPTWLVGSVTPWKDIQK